MTCSQRGGLVAAIVFVMLGAAATATAFTGIATPRAHEIRLPEFAPVAPADLADREASATAALADAFGGRWHAYQYDPYAGAARWVYGSGPRLTAAIRDDAALERAARQVLQDVGAALPVRAGELRLAGTAEAGGKWSARFQQTHGGVDVWQAGATVVFSGDGRLMVVGSTFRRAIDVDPRPTLTAGQALAYAADALPFATAADTDRAEPELLVLPVPVSPSEEEYHLVWRVRLRSEDPLGAWVCHVDAHDGHTVWRYNDIYFAYEGTTGSDVAEDTYCLGRYEQAMPYLRLFVSGLGPHYADASGIWSVDGTGGPREVTADLYSPYVDLDNFAGAEATFTGTAQEDVPLAVTFDDLNSRPDERDVFDAINDVHDFFATFDPDFGYINQRITAYVGRADGYCPGNAWWNGTINFCEAGGGYANTGEIQGVAQHEFGHGVQDYILGYQGGTGMGEGNSDVLANLMTQESIIGPGFYQDECGYGIRNSDNNFRYPDDVVGQEDHFAGQVIAGFHWDAMTLMQGVLGQDEGTLITARTWHEGRLLMQPSSMPSQVLATFVADDDDGNLDNGTPHYPYFCQAAQNHGFDCPEITVGVLISHAPLTDTTDEGPYTLAAEIVSTEAALDPAQLQLVHRTGDGAWIETPLADLGGDMYAASIPALTGGDVDYYFTAADVAGNAARLPALAPDFAFSFLVADAIDAIETDLGWTAGLAGDTATTGQWERVDPIGTIAQPESDHTADGVLCWITGQQVAGQGDGYSDVDGGHTTLTSPVYDLSGYDEVQVRYWKWYSNDRGGTPNADWWDVMVSNDGGATWVELEHTMDSTSGWEAVTFDPVALFGAADQLQLRFVAADEGEGSLVEAGIDDIAIIATAGVTSVDGDDDIVVRMATVLDQNVPNPFNPRTEIRFTMGRPGRASLKVYDVEGRLVRTLVDGALAAGPQQIVWNGTDAAARQVPSGVYFYRLVTPDAILSKRMLLLK